MAALELIVGSLQQTSPPAKGSSSLIYIKPFHLAFEIGRSHKRRLPLPPLQASMASKEDHGATLHKETSQERSSGRSSIHSLLKAVQENHGSNAVMQQVSSLRHFFMPELPFAIITEIKKRMPLSFRDEDEEEMEGSHDRNGGLMVEKELEEQSVVMGPRCAWPRAKLASATEAQQVAEAIRGPRCAWPRGAGQALGSLQQSKLQDEGNSSCSSSLLSAQEGNFVNSKGSTENASGLPEEGFDRLKSVPKRSESSNSHISEGPRCAWPRSAPRRLLATGVGLGIMNYLFVGQGAPALAILLQSSIPITCEEDNLLSPQKSLLP